MIKKLIDAILYSNIFIGVCAVALALTNQITVEGTMQFNSSCWFIFFSTVFTYSYLKLSSTPGAVYSTGHRNWAEEHKQLSRNIMLISLIATVCFFTLLNRTAKFEVVALALVTAFYGFVPIPFTKPKIKLRDLGMLKTFFVAMVWAVTTVAVPMAGNYMPTDTLVFLLLRRFLFVAALTLVFEIKDMPGDVANNLRTLPAVWGVAKVKLLAQIMLGVMIAINLLQYFMFDLPLWNMAAICLSLLISVICIQPVTEETGEGWYYLVLDGMMVLQFVLVYAAAKLFG